MWWASLLHCHRSRCSSRQGAAEAALRELGHTGAGSSSPPAPFPGSLSVGLHWPCILQAAHTGSWASQLCPELSQPRCLPEVPLTPCYVSDSLSKVPRLGLLSQCCGLVGGLQVSAQPGQFCDLVRPYLKTRKRAGDMGKWLSGKALGSVSNRRENK